MVMCVKVRALVPYRSFLCQNETVAFAGVPIVDISMLSPFVIGTPFHALMICLMNFAVPLYFPNFILRVVTIKSAYKRVMNGKPHSKPSLVCMSG